METEEYMKRKVWVTCLFLIALTFLPLTVKASDNIQLLPGWESYHWNDSGKADHVSFSWSVSSGPAIDVFLFTETQYTAWHNSGNRLPASCLIIYVDSTGGIEEADLVVGDTYYVVFSNFAGASTSYISVTVTFHVPFPIMLIIILAGVIAIAVCMILAIRAYHKSHQPAVKPSMPSTAPAASPPGGMVFCIRCGTQNYPAAKFCKGCGATIE
jgi:hypothetical protein